MMKDAPKYLQIIKYYQDLIEHGKLQEEEQMPTESEIGQLFDVSRITVRQALDGLTQLGYIYKVQGKGSFVSSKKTGMQLNQLKGFSEEMKNLGLVPSTILVKMELIHPTEAMAKALEIDVKQQVYAITRIRCADNTKMALEYVHIPFSRFPGLENYDLTESLYSLLKEKFRCFSSKAVQSIQAGEASREDARLLQIKAGAPVLRITRTTYSREGIPFEYVESAYRGDKYIFNVTLEQ